MILALAKAIDSLYAPDRFGLSWQSSEQQSPLSVYARAVGLKIGVSLACDPVHGTSHILVMAFYPQV